MHDLAFRAHRAGVAGQRAYVAYAQVDGGVGLALLEPGMHRAAHRGVQQRRRIAAVHAAERVVVALLGRALEEKATFRPFDGEETDQVADGRAGEFAVADAGQVIQGLEFDDLLDAGGSWRGEASAHGGLRGDPFLEFSAAFGFVHDYSFVGFIWRSTCCGARVRPEGGADCSGFLLAGLFEEPVAGGLEDAL